MFFSLFGASPRIKFNDGYKSVARYQNVVDGGGSPSFWPILVIKLGNPVMVWVGRDLKKTFSAKPCPDAGGDAGGGLCFAAGGGGEDAEFGIGSLSCCQDGASSLPGHEVLVKTRARPTSASSPGDPPGVGRAAGAPFPYFDGLPWAVGGFICLGGWFLLTFILLAVSLPNSEDPEDLRYQGWFPFLSQALWACCVHAGGVCWHNNPCTVFGPKEGS